MHIERGFMCRNPFGKYHRSDEGLSNFFQTIPTHLDFFIINRVINLCCAMKAK